MCRFSSNHVVTAIGVHFCVALNSRRSPSRVDQAEAVCDEEDDRSVKSDLQLAIPRGVYTG